MNVLLEVPTSRRSAPHTKAHHPVFVYCSGAFILVVVDRPWLFESSVVHCTLHSATIPLMALNSYKREFCLRPFLMFVLIERWYALVPTWRPTTFFCYLFLISASFHSRSQVKLANRCSWDFILDLCSSLNSNASFKWKSRKTNSS